MKKNNISYPVLQLNTYFLQIFILLMSSNIRRAFLPSRLDYREQLSSAYEAATAGFQGELGKEAASSNFSLTEARLMRTHTTSSQAFDYDN